MENISTQNLSKQQCKAEKHATFSQITAAMGVFDLSVNLQNLTLETVNPLHLLIF